MTTAQRRPRGSWAYDHRPFGPSPPRAEPHCARQEARMPDLREVFEMVKQQTEADLDSCAEQERRMRREQRKQKGGAFGLVAVFAAAAFVFILSSSSDDGDGVPTSPAESVDPTPDSQAVAPVV